MIKLTFDNAGNLVLSGATDDGEMVLRARLSEVVSELSNQLGAELCLTRDGSAALQFDNAPDVTIAELVDTRAIHCKSLDEMVDALMAEIAEVPDEEDRADHI